MDRNRQSRAEVKVDSENRCVARDESTQSIGAQLTHSFNRGPSHTFIQSGRNTTRTFIPRFQRMFVSVGPNIQVAYGVGMKFSTVDAAFSKHTIYHDGYFHLLTTRDGNNRVLPLAWSLCETESGGTYTWFAEKCKEAGLERYLNNASIIFSDRQKGIGKFHEAFRAFVGSCFKHIIENCNKMLRGTGFTYPEEMAWILQSRPTRAEYDIQLAKLKRVCAPAAKYFDEQVIHKHVYQYKFNENKVATQTFKTSQIGESQNGTFKLARYEAPYRFNNCVLRWMGKELDARPKGMQKWIDKGHLLTPYAHTQWAIQVTHVMHVPWAPPMP